MGTGGRKTVHSLGFSRAVEDASDLVRGQRLYRPGALSLHNALPGRPGAVKEKRKFFPRSIAGVSEFVCVAAQSLPPGCGVLTAFPFDGRPEQAGALKRSFPIS